MTAGPPANDPHDQPDDLLDPDPGDPGSEDITISFRPMPLAVRAAWVPRERVMLVDAALSPAARWLALEELWEQMMYDAGTRVDVFTVDPLQRR